MPEAKKEIAARVRELRECCEIDIAHLASTIGVTLEDYQKMESGVTDFPASLLSEIATTLKTDLTELLTGRPAHMNSFCVTRKDGGVQVTRRKQYGYENLSANFTHKKCEPFIVTVPITDIKPELNTHPGQEFIYMLEGSMLVVIGDNEVTLSSGDSLYIDSTKPHSMKTIGSSPARFLDIIL